MGNPMNHRNRRALTRPTVCTLSKGFDTVTKTDILEKASVPKEFDPSDQAQQIPSECTGFQVGCFRAYPHAKEATFIVPNSFDAGAFSIFDSIPINKKCERRPTTLQTRQKTNILILLVDYMFCSVSEALQAYEYGVLVVISVGNRDKFLRGYTEHLQARLDSDDAVSMIHVDADPKTPVEDSLKQVARLLEDQLKSYLGLLPIFSPTGEQLVYCSIYMDSLHGHDVNAWKAAPELDILACDERAGKCLLRGVVHTKYLHCFFRTGKVKILPRTLEVTQNEEEWFGEYDVARGEVIESVARHEKSCPLFFEYIISHARGQY